MDNSMDVTQNKFLLIWPGVILTEIHRPVICTLDIWFEKHDHQAWVKSGKRDAEAQLNIIKRYAHLNNIDQEFPNTLTATLTGKVAFAGSQEFGLDDVYEWQPAWSRLLNMGIIVNPPATARVLFDYYSPRDPKRNKRGELIQATEHYCLGDIHPFDIGGNTNGIKDELIIVAEAKSSGTIPGIVDYLAEHDNNAVHVRCQRDGVVV